jgi:hypothetical protein
MRFIKGFAASAIVEVAIRRLGIDPEKSSSIFKINRIIHPWT